jgi:hypothetical protein
MKTKIFLSFPPFFALTKFFLVFPLKFFIEVLTGISLNRKIHFCIKPKLYLPNPACSLPFFSYFRFVLYLPVKKIISQTKYNTFQFLVCFRRHSEQLCVTTCNFHCNLKLDLSYDFLKNK